MDIKNHEVNRSKNKENKLKETLKQMEHKKKMEQPIFKGINPERAKALYLDKAGTLEYEARKLEKKANDLERAIQQGKENQSRETDVKKWHAEASALYKEAKELKQKFKNAISFQGGLGITEIKKLTASQLMSDGNHMRMKASSLESQASREEINGNSGKAASLRSEASHLRSEANSKESQGKRILNNLKKKS